MDKESERAKQREDKRIETLQSRHRANMAKKNEQLEDSLRETKIAAQDANSRDREYSRLEAERLKNLNRTYDKHGHYLNEQDIMKHQLERLDQAMEAKSRDLSLQETELKKKHEDQLLNTHKKETEQGAKTVQSSKDAMEAHYNRLAEANNKDYADMREEMQKQYNDLNRNRMEESRMENKRITKAIGDAEEDLEHRKLAEKDIASKQLEEQEKRHVQKLTHLSEKARNDRSEDTHALRWQIKDLIDHERRYGKELGQGTVDAVREFDKELAFRDRVATEGFDNQIHKLQQTAKQKEFDMQEKNARNIRENESRFTDILKGQAEQHNQNLGEQTSLFKKETKELEGMLKNEQNGNRMALEKQAKNADHKMSNALKMQSDTYKNTIERQRLHNEEEAKDVAQHNATAQRNQTRAHNEAAQRMKQSSDEKIDQLSQQLQQRATSSDTSIIPPAAEAVLRKSIIREYDKNFDAERERNFRATESIKNEYADRVKQTVEESNSRYALMNQSRESERALDRGSFLNHVRDVEYMRDTALRSKDYETTRQIDKFNKNYSIFMERQRREYEEILQAQKNEGDAKINTLRQESEFNSRMAQRSFASRQNELIREYDKKISDQKQDFESQLEAEKGHAQKTLRDGERKHRTDLEEQARAYEQKIAQLEYQQKERERYLTQNHQDELEKVKRSNALLIQKKG